MRIGDLAYRLMGISDINMPMLCGEGVGAFIRLQEEIMADDHSLFAWESFDAFSLLFPETPGHTVSLFFPRRLKKLRHPLPLPAPNPSVSLLCVAWPVPSPLDRPPYYSCPLGDHYQLTTSPSQAPHRQLETIG